VKISDDELNDILTWVYGRTNYLVQEGRIKNMNEVVELKDKAYAHYVDLCFREYKPSMAKIAVILAATFMEDCSDDEVFRMAEFIYDES
jgi:hypothetical protein